MIDSAVKEVNGFMSIKRWEDALATVRRQPARYASKEDIQIEAYLLYNLKYFELCGDLCLEHLEKNDDFDFKFILKSCEDMQCVKSALLSQIRACKRLDFKGASSSIGFLLSVFCDIRDVTYYLTSILTVDKDPIFTYLLACIYRISGKLQESIALLEQIQSVYPDASKLLEKVKIEYEAFLKLGRFGSGGKLQMPNLENMNGEDFMVRGFWSIAEKDYQSAFSYLAEAIKMDSSLAVCWYYVGKLQTTFGAKERGEKCFKKFLEYFPFSSGYYKSLAFSRVESEEKKKEYYEKWIGCFPSDPRSWISYLSYLYSKNDYFSIRLIAAEALERYEKEWFVPQDSPIKQIYLGMLNLCLERTSTALEYFKNAVKFEHYKTVALLGIGTAFDNQGVVVDAMSNYEEAMKDPKAEAISKYFMTNVYLKRKNYKKAFATIDELLAKYPESPSAICKKAEIYVQLSDIKGFRKYVSELSNKQMSPELYILAAIVELKEQNQKEAVDYLNKALEEYPDLKSVLTNAATLAIITEDYGRAEEIADKLTKSYIDPYVSFIKGFIFMKKESFAEAKVFIEDYLTAFPFDFKAWLIYGIISVKLNNIKAARLAFEKAVLLSEGKPIYRLNLAVFYASQGMYKEALEYFKISPMENNSYYTLLNVWLLALSTPDETIEFSTEIDKMINNGEYKPEAYNLKAYKAFEIGKLDRAASTIEQGLEKFPDNKVLLYNKVFIKLHLKKYEEAGSILSVLLEKYPQDYQAWLAEVVLQWIRNDQEAVKNALTGAKKLKHPDFNSWLKTASSMKEPLSSISFSVDIDFNFYLPEIFSLNYNDPIGVFAFDKLDAVFHK